MYDLLLPPHIKELNQSEALFSNLWFVRIFCCKTHLFKGLLSNAQNQLTKHDKCDMAIFSV